MMRKKNEEKKTHRSVALASRGSGGRRRGVRHAQTDNMVVTMMKIMSAAIGKEEKDTER